MGVLFIPLVATALAAQNGAVPTIDTVAFESRNVFDDNEATDNFLFRLLNALHIRTRGFVVRQELLFNSGDPADSARLAETERNLRRLGLFREVDIDTLRYGSQLGVRVNTADAWTTTLQADAASTGGQLFWGIGIKEKNILGTGTLFRAKFRNEIDRNSLTLEIEQNRFIGTRFGYHVRYDRLSDGRFGMWRAGVPFRAFADQFALETDADWADRRILQFRNGDIEQEWFTRQYVQRFRVMYAPIAREEHYVRLGLLGQIRREEIFPIGDTTAAIADTVTGAVGARLAWSRANFIVTNYYLAFERDVDVDLSQRAGVDVWLAPAALGYRRNGIGLAADLQLGARWGKQFASLSVSANGLFVGGGLDSGQVRTQLTAVTQAVPRQATVLRLEAGLREGTPPGGAFDIGFDRGLRRFPAHAFTGDQELWLMLEQRAFFVDEFLHLFGIGAAAFADYGGAWYDGQEPRWGGSIGAGLRLSSTRAGDVTVGRLDLAWRYGEGFGDKRWVFSFGRNVKF